MEIAVSAASTIVSSAPDQLAKTPKGAITRTKTAHTTTARMPSDVRCPATMSRTRRGVAIIE